MAIEVIAASDENIPWLIASDRHVSEAWVRRCVSLGEYLIARQDSSPIGFLRFSWFWGTIPYMDLIYVLPDNQRRGAGTALLQVWEEAMRERGARLLMTSSMSDEPEPQAWHRRNGFKVSGKLTFGNLQPVPEVFFIKPL
ncbi:GNAT family N-acetyltransferase [Chelativorans salis]|uniref:GNAT family N-acetyltransferase n=1 Tax=Chelativorans salis TaxID=2978478 RepID=A0ABT2LRN7_9HYPH|nr:GNAT family N-acetyltransferase [Chelativorans sp. EGI FJ00035]MCT7375829.1 GNAT family N-acetyltransferase [Chelativorans sp. EGI FJ00035]